MALRCTSIFYPLSSVFRFSPSAPLPLSRNPDEGRSLSRGRAGASRFIRQIHPPSSILHPQRSAAIFSIALYNDIIEGLSDVNLLKLLPYTVLTPAIINGMMVM
jgi:hypothetical protein